MSEATPTASSNIKVNQVGLAKTDYRGNPTTLCQGCGHNSISNQIIAACYEADIAPEKLVKFSGIGCSSKSPTYFLSRSFGFNSLHGRMPSIATGALFADINLRGMGISGDGDSASIGLGQFKHAVRRSVPMVYIFENNGVYGLTKGQFSATAEVGLELKKQGTNRYLPSTLLFFEDGCGGTDGPRQSTRGTGGHHGTMLTTPGASDKFPPELGRCLPACSKRRLNRNHHPSESGHGPPTPPVRINARSPHHCMAWHERYPSGTEARWIRRGMATCRRGVPSARRSRGHRGEQPVVRERWRTTRTRATWPGGP